MHGGNPEIAAAYTYPFPGLWGWAALAAEVVAYDTWAEWNKEPTMSSTFANLLTRPIVGPITFGATCAVAFHLWQEARRALRQPSS